MKMVPMRFFFRFLKTFDEGQDCDGLNGLSETHFVSKDTVQIRLIKLEKPVQSLQLVVPEGSTNQVTGLLINHQNLILVVGSLFQIFI